MPPPSRHIILPFDLRDQPGEVLRPEKQAVVKSIFPGMTGIAWDGFFVSIQLSTLPPKPWPLTIGGVPLYLTLNLCIDPPVPQGKLVGWRNGSIADDQNGRQMGNWEPLFHVIKDHLHGLGVSITEVMYWGCFFIVVLKHRDADTGKLPYRVARTACLYLFEDQMGRSLAPQARRFTDPTLGNPDHSTFPQQTQLRRLVPVIGRQLYELVYLDSPDTGFIDGITPRVTSYQAIPGDDNSPPQQWIFTTWLYMGQDSGHNLPAGMCGSAIWNEDGDVLGLFRYAPTEGVMMNWCCGLAADELINRGYTVVDTRDRR